MEMNKFNDTPAATGINFPDATIAGVDDIEYLRMVTRLATKGGLKINIEERDDSYRVEIYLENSKLFMEESDDFLSVLRASEEFSLCVVKSHPQKIKATCYKSKK